MIKVTDYYDFTDCDLKIKCVDGQVLRGELLSIDDEDDSGLGEPGISILTIQKEFVGIGESEIESIEALN